MGSVAAAHVHKAAAGEVFLSDVEQTAGGRFRIAARWPDAHPVYQVRPGGGADPVLLVETLRQTAIYLSHRYFAVPQENPFIFGGLTLDVVGRRTACRAPQSSYARLDATCTLTRPPRPNRLALRLEAVIRQGERVCARGAVDWRVISPDAYRALRSRGAAPCASAAAARGELPPPSAEPSAAPDRAGRRAADRPWAGPAAVAVRPAGPDRFPAAAPVAGAGLAPATVGRSRADDVLLTRCAAGPAGPWLLRVDQRHPVYFDHPSDHVPGMVLLEALRQAGHAVVAPAAADAERPIALTGCEVAFRTFCELTSPVVVEAGHAGAAVIGRDGVQALELAVRARQQDRTVADGTMRWAVGPAGGDASALPETAG